MIDLERTILLAEFCGRELVPEGQVVHGNQVAIVNGEVVTGYPFLDVWNPLRDLNALQEVEAAIIQRPDISWLWWVVFKDGVSIVVGFKDEVRKEDASRDNLRLMADTKAEALSQVVEALQKRKEHASGNIG